MILIISTFFIFLFNVAQTDEIINDENYYEKGVSLYNQGIFDESFIVFFNLSEKGYEDAVFNISNMYYEGVGTIQNYRLALKYSWLCALNGNKRCIKKLKKVKDKVSEKEMESVSQEIPVILEKNFNQLNQPKYAFKMGYWHEKFSPVEDLESAYLWYSVSVGVGIYKAMKLRDRVGKKIDKEKIGDLQKKAKEIYTKEKYFKQNNVVEENT